jgi:hypothetical protein
MLESILFPRNKLAIAAIVCSLSGVLAFYLIGRQIWAANWWLIDDHEIFSFLGNRDRLPLSELFHTLFTKTEVGTLDGRFRPSYYLLRVLETCLWGTDVHLWYLTRTACFALFVASTWWLFIRLGRFWLGTALMVPVLTLPFWSDVWARLGPSETYGAAATGLLILGLLALHSAEKNWQRNLSAATIVLATIVLIGSKETFIPIAAIGPAALLFEAARRRLSIAVTAIAMTLICAAGLAVVGATWKVTSDMGGDIYANKIDGIGLLRAALLSRRELLFPLLCYVAAIGIMGLAAKRSGKSFSEWQRSTLWIAMLFGYLSAVLVSQHIVYRAVAMPTGMRYDFPTVLFGPFAFAVLAWYVLHHIELNVSDRFADFASLALAIGVLGWYAPTLRSFASSPLPQAVEDNIKRTSAFFPTVQSIVSSARQSPQGPIILEAYGAGAYEPIYSMQAYLRALGASNLIAVRFYPDAASNGALYDGLERRMLSYQDNGNDVFQPLSKGLESASYGCVSVGLNGSPSPQCAKGYEIKW